MRGTVNHCLGNVPLSRPAIASVQGYGWVSELPGRDRQGRKLAGPEARSDWGFTTDSARALVLAPYYQVRLYAYYVKNLRRSVAFIAK